MVINHGLLHFLLRNEASLQRALYSAFPQLHDHDAEAIWSPHFFRVQLSCVLLSVHYVRCLPDR